VRTVHFFITVPVGSEDDLVLPFVRNAPPKTPVYVGLSPSPSIL
jgi:hypothetical protein